MAGPFELSLRQFAQEAGENADAVVRNVVLEIGARLVIRSPVDTGRFRSNWRYSLNVQVVGVTTEATKVSTVNGLDALPAHAGGQVHYLQNNLPYAQRLEHGWSKQAPIGMVGLTVLEFASIVDGAAQGLASFSVAGIER